VTSCAPTARLSTPGEIAATIPTLCGFRPEDSVVVLSLRGPRRRLGLTIRLDLPPPAQVEQAAAMLAARVAEDGGSSAVVAVFGAARRPDLVTGLSRACGLRQVDVVEAVHVDDGRWTSYLCAGPCCPASGTPVPEVPVSVGVQAALDGRAVLPGRADLVRALQPTTVAPPDVLRVARTQLALRRAELGADPARAVELAHARDAMARVAAGAQVEVADCVRIALGLHDVAMRDEVVTWALDDGDALLALAEQVARRVGPPDDAPVCTLLAWVAYSRGDGARANVALDRALASDPSYSLAVLLQSALDAAVPPEAVRRTRRETARALRSR
jgi:hypothetical protein